MQAVGEDMHLGLFPGDDFAVKPDGAVALVKRQDGHRNSPNSIFTELQPILLSNPRNGGLRNNIACYWAAT